MLAAVFTTGTAVNAQQTALMFAAPARSLTAAMRHSARLSEQEADTAYPESDRLNRSGGT